ncbi:hypothetical protein PISMIDRAFT_115708, partial [Pisolithus microcarpus 441]
NLVSERHGKYSKTAKVDVVVWPTTLAFFGPLWCKLLDEAKGRMRLYVATEVPFLRREMAIDGICMEILVEMYCLYPPKNIEDDGEHIEFVKKKAAQLLEGVQYLHGDVDSLGRTSNFAHPALRKICLAVYYCNSLKSLRQFVEFQTSVPDRALVLVSAIICRILMMFKKHGTIKNETLCGEEVDDTYHNLTSLVDQVWHNEYHGNKLERMLQEWARAGM